MNTIELIYNFAVLAMATLILFMDFTAPNALLEFVLKAIGKIVPLFMIGYAIVQIFKYYGIMQPLMIVASYNYNSYIQI